MLGTALGIIAALIVVVIMEGILLKRVFSEYRKQLLKSELLTQIIEERFSENEKDINIRKLSQSSGTSSKNKGKQWRIKTRHCFL